MMKKYRKSFDVDKNKLAKSMERINTLEILMHQNTTLSVQWMIKLITMATLFELG